MADRPTPPSPSTDPVLGRRRLLVSAAGGLLGLAGARVARAADALDEIAAFVTGQPGRPTMTVRDESLAAARAGGRGASAPAIQEVPLFDLFGLHWRGDGSVWFRTRDAGAWSGWQQAVVHELPDADGSEVSREGWTIGTPVWTGGSDAVQLRVAGNVRAVRGHYVASPTNHLPLPSVVERAAAAEMPAILTRSDWGANEGIVRAKPRYAHRLILALVHHTAGRSPSSRARSAAVVRAIQVYHVEGNGWNDIGYNYLVDRFGQVFEGRRGGVDRNVIGAHALNFNNGSTGVALLGNFEGQNPPQAGLDAIARLLAWRLDLAHVDPLSVVSYVGNGRTRTLNAVSGHRDVNSTACPGARLHARLGSIAAAAAETGLPKLFEPRAERQGKRIVRFSGRLSDARDWTVTISGPPGFVGALARGTGTLVDWTWDGTGAPEGRYRWTIEAGPDVRPANGSFKLGIAPTEPPVVPPPPPARPGSIPRRIPRWAWSLRRWQETSPAKRGARPGSPSPIPRWYWEWLNWLAARKRWRRTWGRNPR